MTHLCPLCNSSLYHEPPASESNNNLPLEDIPEHLRQHRCCGTKCAHLIHTACLCRHLLGKSYPECPVCTKEVHLEQVNPLNLPTPSFSRWVQYPKSVNGDLRLVLKQFSQNSNERPAFVRLRQEKLPVGNNLSKEPPQEKESDNEPLWNLEGFIIYIIQSWLPVKFRETIGQVLDQTQDNRAARKLMKRFVKKMKKLTFQKTFHSFQLLPGVVNWLLSLDPEKARKWLETWNGHLPTFQSVLDEQLPREGPTEQHKTYLLTSFSTLMTAFRNIGAVDFFRLTLLYNDLNRDGLLDTMKSRLETMLARFLQLLLANGNFAWSAGGADIIQGVDALMTLMDTIVEWMRDQGFFEQ